MSTVPGATTYYCRHGIDIDYCAVCRPPPMPQLAWFPAAAGHCGKCGAPYTAENQVCGPTKFTATCKCWNV